MFGWALTSPFCRLWSLLCVSLDLSVGGMSYHSIVLAKNIPAFNQSNLLQYLCEFHENEMSLQNQEVQMSSCFQCKIKWSLCSAAFTCSCFCMFLHIRIIIHTFSHYSRCVTIHLNANAMKYWIVICFGELFKIPISFSFS